MASISRGLITPTTSKMFMVVLMENVLSNTVGVSYHICALCYVFDNAVKCSNCGKYICDACTPWSLEHGDVNIIEARCPVCVSMRSYIMIFINWFC